MRTGRRVPRCLGPFLTRSKLADNWARPRWVDGVVGWLEGAWLASNFRGKRQFGGENDKGGKRKEREKKKKSF